MQRNAVWWAQIFVVAVIALVAGCRFPSLSSAKRETRDNREQPPNNRQIAEVQLSLARSLERRGEIEPAIEAYRKAVEKDPQRATGYWRMAILQDRQGNVDESESLYRKARKLDPKNPDLICDFGYSLYLHRRWAEAEECLRQAIALKSRHARAHNNLGLLLAQGERTEEALAEFRKAGCDESDARTNLAFVMTMNHRWVEAREQYELALDANPDAAAARSGLEKLDALVAKLPPRSEKVTQVAYDRSHQESREKEDSEDDDRQKRSAAPRRIVHDEQ